MSQFITFLGSDLINALGWTFVHTLWQGCLIVLLMIFVLQRIPTKNAVLRYTIATASMFSMLVAAVATFALLYFEPGQSGPLATSATAQKIVVGESGGLSFIQWLGDNLSAMVAIWIIGVVLLACRMLFGLAYIQYLRNTASDLSFKLGSRVEAIAKKIDYTRPLDIAESALVKIPVVVGYLKPIILFPIGAVNQLSNDEVEAVLAHEIAHLVRNDFVQNIVQSIIEIIFYYHPAVWWISAVVRSERENCCDDLAIEVCGSSFTYARALVRLQEVGQSTPALALSFSGPKNHLLIRVKRILNEPHNKSNLMEKITATGLLLLCLVFASFSDGADAVEVQKAETQEIAVFNQRVRLLSLTVKDTVIPQKSHTIKVEESDGKKVRLEIEDGKILHLNVNGEEIPESRYEEYADYIEQLQSQIPNVPEPPMAPRAPMARIAETPVVPRTPSAPAVPRTPRTPGTPATPNHVPAPATPPMPPLPITAPAPSTPQLPTSQGMLYEFDGDFDFAPYNVEHNVTTTRTESTIIREIDENGNVSYHIAGDHADDTTIEIDYATGTAIIDGQEIIIDADSIVIIEEIESGPRGYAFVVNPNQLKSHSQIESYTWSNSFDIKDFDDSVYDQYDNLIKSDGNAYERLTEFEWVIDNDSMNNALFNDELNSNKYISTLKEAQELYLLHLSGDEHETTIELFEQYGIAQKESDKYHEHDAEYTKALKRAIEAKTKAIKEKKSSKNDQSGIMDLEVERTFVLNSDTEDDQFVTLTVKSDDNDTWVAETVKIDSDEQVITLIGNVVVNSSDENGDPVLLKGDKVTYDYIVKSNSENPDQEYQVVVKEVEQTDAEGIVVEGKTAYKVTVEDGKSKDRIHPKTKKDN